MLETHGKMPASTFSFGSLDFMQMVARGSASSSDAYSQSMYTAYISMLDG